MLEIRSLFSLLCSVTDSIQLPRKHFFRDQWPVSCLLCLHLGYPLCHILLMFSKVLCGLTRVLAAFRRSTMAMRITWEHVAVECMMVNVMYSHRHRIPMWSHRIPNVAIYKRTSIRFTCGIGALSSSGACQDFEIMTKLDDQGTWTPNCSTSCSLAE